MRIETLTVQNFKKFDRQFYELPPQFTLPIGENGSGKTSVLDALAVAMGIWLVEPPDTTLNASRRNILRTEIRLEPSRPGDRLLFREQRPVIVAATGKISDRLQMSWRRQMSKIKSSLVHSTPIVRIDFGMANKGRSNQPWRMTTPQRRRLIS